MTARSCLAFVLELPPKPQRLAVAGCARTQGIAKAPRLLKSGRLRYEQAIQSSLKDAPSHSSYRFLRGDADVSPDCARVHPAGVLRAAIRRGWLGVPLPPQRHYKAHRRAVMSRTHHHRGQRHRHNGQDFWSRFNCNKHGGAGIGPFAKRLLHKELRCIDREYRDGIRED